MWMDFGDWIREYMRANHITDEQAYERAGMGRTAWSRLVNRPPLQPHKKTIEAVARGLQAPLPLVYAAAGYEPEPDIDVRFARRAMPYLNSMPPDVRQKAEEMVIGNLRVLAEMSA